jgi:hypothetical protein
LKRLIKKSLDAKKRNIGEYSMKVKKVYLIILWILLLSTLLVTGCKQENDQLDIDFELGYEDSVKVSKGNPLTATIKNKGKEFIGELQIEVNQTQSESLIFAKEFQISENGEKEINMVIPVYTIQRKFKVAVISEGKQIFEDTIDVGSFISPNQAIVGVISDQPDEYRFLNSSNYNNYFGEQELMDYYYQSVQPKEEIKETNEPKIFYFDNHANPWDLSAAVLIIKNSGGFVTDLSGVDINPVSHKGYIVASANEKVRDEFLAMINEVFSH